jgi:hypothetical protein
MNFGRCVVSGFAALALTVILQCFPASARIVQYQVPLTPSQGLNDPTSIALDDLTIYRKSTSKAIALKGQLLVNRVSFRNLPTIEIRGKGFEVLVAEREVLSLVGHIHGSLRYLTKTSLDAGPNQIAYCPPPDLSCGGGGGGGDDLYDPEPWGACYVSDCGWGSLGGFGYGLVIDGPSGMYCPYYFASGYFGGCYIASVLPSFGRDLFISHHSSPGIFGNTCRYPVGQPTYWSIFYYQGDTIAISVISFTSGGYNIFVSQPPGFYTLGVPARLDLNAFITGHPFPSQYYGYCNYAGL